MTHPKEAVDLLARAIQESQCRALMRVDQGMRIVSAPDQKAEATDAAAALLDQIAPMLAARADADAREAALQYLSDTGQLMDRIAAMEADTAAAVEAMREAAIAACLTQKTKFADATKSDWERGNDSGALGCTYAIRALSPPPAARGQDVEAMRDGIIKGMHIALTTPIEQVPEAIAAALAPFTGGKA